MADPAPIAKDVEEINAAIRDAGARALCVVRDYEPGRAEVVITKVRPP